jgi:aspartate/methionine/tyrosine aminotransferase
MSTITSSQVFADRISRIEVSATLAVAAEAAKLRARGANLVDFGAGEPHFSTPQHIKDAAVAAIDANFTRYTAVQGIPDVRKAIVDRHAADFSSDYAIDEAIFTTGGKQALFNSIQILVDHGDEVILPIPYWVSFKDIIQYAGGKVVFLETQEAENFRITTDAIEKAITPRTKAIILNSPNNPTGKVFSRAELEFIAGLCQEFDALAITDEIYEHILYDGAAHCPMITIDGMRERTILVNSMSKTYAVTGWRVGWVLAGPELTESIRKVHDFLTVGAAAPLQQAGALALSLPDSYYEGLAADYSGRRAAILTALAKAGFRSFHPRGAYYVMTDISGFGFDDDISFARFLIEKIGVAAVPGSSFYATPEGGRQQIRFCFCKKHETLDLAGQQLMNISSQL